MKNLSTAKFQCYYYTENADRKKKLEPIEEQHWIKGANSFFNLKYYCADREVTNIL